MIIPFFYCCGLLLFLVSKASDQYCFIIIISAKLLFWHADAPSSIDWPPKPLTPYLPPALQHHRQHHYCHQLDTLILGPDSPGLSPSSSPLPGISQHPCNLLINLFPLPAMLPSEDGGPPVPRYSINFTDNVSKVMRRSGR